MPIVVGPQPGFGAEGDVILDFVPLRVKPNTYSRSPAQRFGQKISQGLLSPNDFNPYESATTISNWTNGYGVRRYSDIIGGFDVGENNYKESSNVDARAPGVTISPALTTITLPTSAATPVWMGEWTPSAGTVTGVHWVIVAGTKVFYLSSATTATNSTYTLAATAVQGAIVASGGQLIIGYGSAHTAQYITTLDASVGVQDVKDTTPAAIYVFAATADHASIYVAGGEATTNSNLVISSLTTASNPAQSFATTGTTCGANDAPITGLSPGGGVVLVFVFKTSELGMIDTTSSIYHVLIPFYSRLSTNGVGATWFQGAAANETQGPLILIFPRQRSIWSYQPSTQDSGTATNLAPWGKAGFRPVNARGVVTAITGSPHFLYYAINTSGGNTWIIANDGITGANHTYRFNSSNSCNAMGITSIFATNPYLYIGYGNNIAQIILPADGDCPVDDANCIFDTGTCTFDLPDIDLGFPDEEKIAFYIRVVADNIAPGGQTISVAYAADGASSYTTLGTVTQTPTQDLTFPTALAFKRLALRMTFTTTDTTKTPILLSVSVRVSINPKQYATWSLDATVPEGTMKTLADSQLDVQAQTANFWSAYEAGLPVLYQDRWQNLWWVRILDMTETWNIDEVLRTPTVTWSFVLLEVSQGPGNLSWDASLSLYDQSWAIYN